MQFHTFGEKKNPVMLLIHGMLTPWQIWEDVISCYSERYYVVVPALDGHIQEEPSEFLSVEEEARQMEQYVLEHCGKRVFAVMGLSLGGAIANQLFENRTLEIEKLVIDGGPLLPMNRMLKAVMTKQYLMLVRKSKQRDPKILESFEKDFLPKKYLEPYLKFADTMSDSTIENKVSSVCATDIHPAGNAQITKILFLHGTVANETISKKAAEKMKSFYPETQIKCFKGLKHAELLCFRPKEWIEVVDVFLKE